MAESSQRLGGDWLMTWKQTALSLFVLYVASMLVLSVYIGGVVAAHADLQARYDLMESQLPDTHETAFGE